VPLLSVVMPARNAEQTISAAVQSVLRALPKDSELLVWDDASSDRTMDIISAFRDPRVTVESSNESIGSGAARSRLLEHSDSRFVATADADDICLPWRFRLQLRALQLQGSGMNFSTAIRFGAGRTISISYPWAMSTQDVRASLLVYNPLFHSTMTSFRASVYEAGGYGAARVAQDYALWLRAAARGIPMAKIRIPVAMYRLSSTQVSASEDYFERIRQEPEVRAAYSELWLSAGGTRDPFASDQSTVHDFLNTAVRSAEPSVGRRTKARLLSQMADTGSFSHGRR
jgi:glycosyltransferase involved in cell wall biosynthesis